MVDDLDVFEKSCSAIGMKLVRGRTDYKWSGTHPAVALPPEFDERFLLGMCEHAVKVEGKRDCFEIGLVPLADGKGHGMIWDERENGFGLMEVAGPGCSRLIDRYEADRQRTRDRGRKAA